MPAPIMPAPITPTRLAEVAGTSLGREPPRLRWLRSKKNALVMLRCTGEPTSEANQRPSTASAVSKSTEAPSTTAHRMACGGRVVRALELLAQVGRERRQHHRQLLVGRASAGHPVAGAVPRLAGHAGVALHPGDRGREQFVLSGHQLVDETDVLGLGRAHPLPLHQHVQQRVLDAEHPGHPLGAAATGQQAEGHLGQAEAGVGPVHRDAVQAGQAELHPAAERGAVERGHDRPAELLQPAERVLDLLADPVRGRADALVAGSTRASPAVSSLRSAPARNESLAEVTTTPVMASRSRTRRSVASVMAAT